MKVKVARGCRGKLSSCPSCQGHDVLWRVAVQVLFVGWFRYRFSALLLFASLTATLPAYSECFGLRLQKLCWDAAEDVRLTDPDLSRVCRIAGNNIRPCRRDWCVCDCKSIEGSVKSALLEYLQFRCAWSLECSFNDVQRTRETLLQSLYSPACSALPRRFEK